MFVDDREVHQSECFWKLVMSNCAKDISTASRNWYSIESAPKNKDVMLLAKNAEGDTFLMLRPARLTNQGWVYASTGKPIEVEPLMWHPASLQHHTRMVGRTKMVS
jgi:hypothetical protein